MTTRQQVITALIDVRSNYYSYDVDTVLSNCW